MQAAEIAGRLSEIMTVRKKNGQNKRKGSESSFVQGVIRLTRKGS
jgi:hypothetical protein